MTDEEKLAELKRKFDYAERKRKEYSDQSQRLLEEMFQIANKADAKKPHTIL